MHWTIGSDPPTFHATRAIPRVAPIANPLAGSS
jgi:hypothetical protein